MPSLTELKNEFRDQARNPLANDKYIAVYCEAALALLSENGPFKGEIVKVLKEKNIQKKHIVNQVLRAFQAEVAQEDHKYPDGFEDIQIWKKELTEHAVAIHKILIERETVTTLLPRYASSRAILGGLFKGMPIKLADGGCGGNYGLKGFSLGEKFSGVVDHTKGKMFSKCLEEPFNMSDGLAIDYNDPEDPDTRAWRFACSAYPSEWKVRKSELEALERRLNADHKVKFVKADLTSLGNELDNGKGIKSGDRHAVILSTVLYQQTDKQAMEIVNTALKMLNDDPRSILIIQEYAKKNTRGWLNFDVSWGVPGNYRTFIMGKITGDQLWEIFKWKNGRCKEVWDGKDMKKFHAILKFNGEKPESGNKD